jgi:hypothetical protein
MLGSASASGQVVYTFTGSPFTSADPPYSLGGQVTGSFTVATALAPLLPLGDISGSVVDFTFTDGVQTRTPATTNVCTFDIATDANGAISHWQIFLREAPFPGAGNPVQTLDLNGPIPGPGVDQVGEATAGAAACADLSVFSFSADSSAAGSFSSTAVPPPDPTVYTYSGNLFNIYDPPYTSGNRITGSLTVAAPLPPLLPPTDMKWALSDFSFTDGVQTRTQANSFICDFQVATDAIGNISHWRIVLREGPFPAAGMQAQSLDMVGPIPGPGLDQGLQGEAGSSPCGAIDPVAFSGANFNPGNWSSTALPPATPASYYYTGGPFTVATPPYAIGGRVTGGVTLAGPLPQLLPLTDMRWALEGFSFTDGIQTRGTNNSFVCRFELATDSMGDITNWAIFLREMPFPGLGIQTETLDTFGPTFGPAFDTVGEGPGDAIPCGPMVLPISGESSVPGSWRTVLQSPRIPTVSELGLGLLVVLLAGAGVFLLYRGRA